MYLLCIYESYADGTAERKTIKDCESYNEALRTLFSEQAKAIGDDNVHLLMTTILTEKGVQCRTEVYDADA